MNAAVIWQLVRKDLYLVRWMIVGSIIAGLVSIAMMPLGTVSAYVGGVSLICVLIVLNIFLVMGGVVQERKDKVLLFVLSLPISTTEYTVAKVLANGITFTAPWLILTLANAVMINTSQIADGLLPFWLTVLAYMFFYYCTLLAVSLVTDSTGWHTAAIIVGNVSVNFLIPVLLSRPSVAAHSKSQTAVWTLDIVTIIGVEVLAGLAALWLAVYFQSRRRDFV